MSDKKMCSCGMDSEWPVRAERAEKKLHEVIETYAGMEGFEAKTAPEAYCLRIIEQMYKAATQEEGDD